MYTSSSPRWSSARHGASSTIIQLTKRSQKNGARAPSPLGEGASCHSDDYASSLLGTRRLRLPGACSAASARRAELFFGALKNELVHRTTFPTRAHAHRAIVRYIEMFYNRKRLHSGLGYKTPAEVHAECDELQAAAYGEPSTSLSEKRRAPHTPLAAPASTEIHAPRSSPCTSRTTGYDQQPRPIRDTRKDHPNEPKSVRLLYGATARVRELDALSGDAEDSHCAGVPLCRLRTAA
ncbi:IS3 family transposase [Streptomyces mirabilis]|uniref:IS3 family transposase n=1 Tax=Streptomyces mirabilis TaxID=68239 RepID=UPI0036939144